MSRKIKDIPISPLLEKTHLSLARFVVENLPLGYSVGKMDGEIDMQFYADMTRVDAELKAVSITTKMKQ